MLVLVYTKSTEPQPAPPEPTAITWSCPCAAAAGMGLFHQASQFSWFRCQCQSPPPHTRGEGAVLPPSWPWCGCGAAGVPGRECGWVPFPGKVCGCQVRLSCPSLGQPCGVCSSLSRERGREGGSSCQPSLAGSPRGGFWLLPSRNKDRFLPLRPGSGASVLPHDLGSRELWPALAAAVPSPGDLFLAVYFRALFLCSVRRCCVASADRDQITVPWGNHLLDFQRSPGTFPLWVRSSGKARALLRVGSGPLSGSV